MQDQQGDLATLAEEAASGIRVTKAFGRGPWLTTRFLDSAGLVRGSQLDMVGLLGRFWSLLHADPEPHDGASSCCSAPWRSSTAR